MARIAGQLPNYTWLKFPLSYLYRREFMDLKDEHTSIFIKTYALAAVADSGGLIADDQKALTIDDIAWFLRRDNDLVKAAIDELVKSGFINQSKDGFEISNFEIEQGPGLEDDREKWRTRQARSRARRTGKNLDDIDQDVDIDQDLEEEKKRKEENRLEEIRLECHGDKKNCHGDNSQSNSSFLFFSEKMAGFFDFCFGENMEDLPQEQIDYWVDQYKKHGSFKLFAFWNWVSDKKKTSNDAYQINNKKNMIKGWESENQSHDDGFAFFPIYIGEVEEISVYHRGKSIFNMPGQEPRQKITFEDAIESQDDKMIKVRKFFIDGEFEKSIPWDELGIRF